METLDIVAYQEKKVTDRAIELIAATKTGRADRSGRATNLFVTNELRYMSDVLAMETLKASNLEPTGLAVLLPEVFHARSSVLAAEPTLGEALRNAFVCALSDRGLAAARPFIQEHVSHIELSDIVNVLQRGYSRVAKRRDAGDVYGRISLHAEIFIENPSLENFRSLIKEASYLDAALEQEHFKLCEKTPHRKSGFQDISRAVFEMNSIGQDISKDESLFFKMVERFKTDINEDKVEVYLNDGVNRLRA